MPAGTVSVALADAAPSVELRSTVDVSVTVTATNFSGPLALSATGLPTDVTASFDNPAPTLSAGSASAKLTLTTLSSTRVGSVAFTVTTTASGATIHGAPGNLTVQPVLTITIPANVDASEGTTSNPNTHAFGAYPITISTPPSFPVTINFYNADGIPHTIHADQATEGFFHGNDIAPGTMDQPRGVTQSDTYDFYLHDENAALTVGRIVIQ
jgi:hypothetical protein